MVAITVTTFLQYPLSKGEVAVGKDLISERDLRTLYPQPHPLIENKAFAALDPHARRFIELSPFFCIGSSRSDDLADVSPRGGEPGFVHVLDDTHIAFPDRPGNNRLDTLTNIVHRPAVGLLFFAPGVHEMLRLNGIASITAEESLMTRFVEHGKRPRSVMLITVLEVYLHCSKALRRADLWNPQKAVRPAGLPTLGVMLRDQFRLDVDAANIDSELDEDARNNLY
jgi:PPOX class probable FMN-dependent enzyme